MINIIDIGCRYGVYPLFKDVYKNFNYIGVDADNDEISRLKKKYKHNKIKFYSKFLTSENKLITFNQSDHKGYYSSKKINADSLWFGILRSNEKKINNKIQIKGTKSSDFINKYIDNKFKAIVKVDIEGSELDFLKGLDAINFDQIDAFVVEAHFDNPYHSNSNFYSISSYLKEKGYWLSSINLENNLISKFCEPKDCYPLSSTNIYLKNNYKPIKKFVSDSNEEMCEILYALKLEYLLLYNLEKFEYKKIKNFKLFNEFKYIIGHKFNRLIKLPHFKKNEVVKKFQKIFNTELPIQSNFFESSFYNK